VTQANLPPANSVRFTRCQTNACRQGLSGGRRLAYRLKGGQGGAYGTLGIGLIGLRPAEIDQDAVAHVLGNKAFEPLYRLGDAPIISTDHLAQVLRVKTRRESGRADEVAKHHRELTTLGRGHGR